jgi:MFS family permease
MRALLDRYAEFFRQRGVVRLAAFGFIARMPIGTAGIATLLHVRELTGSIAFAGLAVGAWYIAAATTAPLQGRLIDTRGPRPVLYVTGVMSPLAMLLILFARELALPHVALVAASALAGAFAPPVTVTLRTVWRHRFDTEELRRRAYAIDGVLLEIAYTVGPAAVAAIVAVASPRAALAFSWIFIALAVPMFFAGGGLHWWQPAPPAHRRLLGPLHDGQLVAVYLATFFLTVAFGCLEVGYPAFATAQGSTPWGPTFIAINSIGSAIGGVVYGGLRFSMPVQRQLPRVMALLALPLAVHAMLSSVPGMAPWAFIAGLLIAPAMAAVAVIVSTLAPAKYATEAFTWSSTAIVTGVGAGMAIAGTLAERVSTAAPFAFAATSALVAAALALRVAR